MPKLLCIPNLKGRSSWGDICGNLSFHQIIRERFHNVAPMLKVTILPSAVFMNESNFHCLKTVIVSFKSAYLKIWSKPAVLLSVLS